MHSTVGVGYHCCGQYLFVICWGPEQRPKLNCPLSLLLAKINQVVFSGVKKAQELLKSLFKYKVSVWFPLNNVRSGF